MDIETKSMEFKSAILSMNRFDAEMILNAAFETSEGFVAVEEIVLNAQESIGAGWERGDLSLAQVYMSGVLCEELMSFYLPEESDDGRDHPSIAIAVLEDFHTMGKDIVCSILRSHGYQFTDYGHGLTVEEVAQRASSEGVEILMISTLMLNSALRVVALKKRLAELGSVPLIFVGGAPFRMDPNLWQEVGADGTSGRASGIMDLLAEKAEVV